VAGNASTCAKAPSLQRARVCVRTIARLEGQIVQTYRQMNRFANRVPVFSLDPFEAG
jgi:hypothetical protein